MNLFLLIRNKIKSIPAGKVSTYGLIARAVGVTDSRKVGWAVYGNRDPLIPCHRVVFKDGLLAPRFSLGGWREQKRRLKNEGVTFTSDNRVSLNKHLWKPESDQ